MIRPVPPSPAYNPTPLQAAADKHLQDFADAVASAIRRVRATLTIAGTARQIEEAGFASVDADWSEFWTLTKSGPNYEAAYLETVLDGAQQATSVRLQSAFALVNERAVDIAQRRAAELVVGLSRDSRAALNHVIATAVGGQQTVRESARLLRDVVGLDPRRAQGLVTYRRSLSANLNPLDVDRLVAAHAENAVAQRAITIARTETMRAAHDGQRALWDQAAAEGLIDPATTSRVWIVTPDDRLCPECAPFDGVVVPYEGSFGGVDEPPLHPQCRCDLALQFD